MDVILYVANSFSVREIDFETIFPYWKEHLWPERKSRIEPVSYIILNGQIDGSIREFEPRFFSICFQNEIIGVLSYHATASNTFRLRGLWISPLYRNQKLGTRLINEVLSEIPPKPHLIWLMSRMQNRQYYKNFGFEYHLQVEGYEYGPHMIMIKRN